MITQTRFTALAVMALFSCLLIGFLVYIPVVVLSNQAQFWNSGLFMVCTGLGSIFVIPVILLAASPVSDRVASLFFPIRKQSMREEEKINPALERVLQLYRERYGKDIPVEVKVMDMPNINGIALGRKTVAVSRGLLSVASDEELAAVLSHEIGHLHNGDGVLNMTLFAASSPTIMIHRVFTGIVLGCPKPDMKLNSKNDDIMDLCLLVAYGLLMAFCTVFLWPCIIVLWLMRSVDFATAWPIEYRADRFAANLGYAPAMIELLERIEDEDVRGATGFLKKYLYSHPPTALRIDRLERGIVEDVKKAA